MLGNPKESKERRESSISRELPIWSIALSNSMILVSRILQFLEDVSKLSLLYTTPPERFDFQKYLNSINSFLNGCFLAFHFLELVHSGNLWHPEKRLLPGQWLIQIALSNTTLALLFSRSQTKLRVIFQFARKQCQRRDGCISRKQATLLRATTPKEKRTTDLTHSLLSSFSIVLIEFIATLQQAKLTQQRHSYFFFCMTNEFYSSIEYKKRYSDSSQRTRHTSIPTQIILA